MKYNYHTNIYLVLSDVGYYYQYFKVFQDVKMIKNNNRQKLTSSLTLHIGFYALGLYFCCNNRLYHIAFCIWLVIYVIHDGRDRKSLKLDSTHHLVLRMCQIQQNLVRQWLLEQERSTTHCTNKRCCCFHSVVKWLFFLLLLRQTLHLCFVSVVSKSKLLRLK